MLFPGFPFICNPESPQNSGISEWVFAQSELYLAKFYRKKRLSELSIVDGSGLIPASVADQLSFRQVSTMSSSALRVYDEVVEFMAAGPSAAQIVAFQLSDATKRRVAELIFREKTDGLTADEKSELDHFLQLEYLMRLTKARAHKYAAP